MKGIRIRLRFLQGEQAAVMSRDASEGRANSTNSEWKHLGVMTRAGRSDAPTMLAGGLMEMQRHLYSPTLYYSRLQHRHYH